MWRPLRGESRVPSVPMVCSITREELPAVREAELRSVLKVLGVNPPLFLGYKDQELSAVNVHELSSRDKLCNARHTAQTWSSPLALPAFHITTITSPSTGRPLRHFVGIASPPRPQPRLFYVAIPEEMASQLDMHLHPSETSLNVVIDITEHKDAKIRAIRMFNSQEDAQQIAELFENNPYDAEAFHQACPRAPVDSVSAGFWE